MLDLPVIKLSLAIVFVIAAAKSTACTCVFVFNDKHYFKKKYNEADLVALIEVNSPRAPLSSFYKDVKVLELWKGSTEVTILQNTFDNCSPSIQQGKYYLFAVKTTNENTLEPQACSFTMRKRWLSKESRFVSAQLKHLNRATHESALKWLDTKPNH